MDSMKLIERMCRMPAAVLLAFVGLSCGGGSDTPTGPSLELNSLELISVSPEFGSTLTTGTHARFRLRYRCDLSTCFINVNFFDGLGSFVNSSSFGNPVVGRGEGTAVISAGARRPGVTEEVRLTLDDSLLSIPLVDPPLFETRIRGRFTWQ